MFEGAKKGGRMSANTSRRSPEDQAEYERQKKEADPAEVARFKAALTTPGSRKTSRKKDNG